MLAFAAPPVPLVRIALIGLGRRGMKTLDRYRHIRGAEICALCDVDETRVAEAARQLAGTTRTQAATYHEDDGWRRILERTDIDLVYICTDWESHTPLAVAAMEAGKHVALEIPAATSIDECWQLVETAERTRRHCFMTENCCYDLFALATYEMCRQGLFGRINHVEGAYIHDLCGADLTQEDNRARADWMANSLEGHGGNAYPTHGMGPIGWLLGLHRGNRMKELVSMTAHGGVSNTIISTEDDTTILLQLDVATPRPYSRLQTVCGTEGFAQKYPLPMLNLPLRDMPLLTGESALEAAKPFTQENPAVQFWREGHELGVPNEMNYAMDSRLIYCLQRGLPLDIDVYDAAEWSCIAELTYQSARGGGKQVSIPDFTRGRWKELEGHRFYV